MIIGSFICEAPRERGRMIIRHITIDNYGGIKHLTRRFTQGINRVDPEEARAIFGAIGRVFRSPVITFDADGGPPVTDETLIRAEIDINQERYTITIRGRLPSGGICYDVEGPGFHETDTDEDIKTDKKKVTGARFYNRIYRSLEEASLSTYRYSPRDPYAKRLAEYMDREDTARSEQTAKETDNIVNTAVFRRCLKDYIDGYEPEWIDQSRNVRAYLGKNGVFTHRREAGEEHSLSAKEKVLSDFSCFLKLNEFWKSVEQIRDMNHADWPLFIEGLAQHVDQSDITFPLRQAEALGRQVFFVDRGNRNTEKEKTHEVQFRTGSKAALETPAGL